MRAVNQIPLFRVSLEARDRLFEALTNFLGRFFQKWVVNRQRQPPAPACAALFEHGVAQAGGFLIRAKIGV